MGTRDCGHEISMSTPSPGEAGDTGDWRTARPTLRADLCLAVRQNDLACQLCWVYCPDVCVARGIPPTMDLRYCKGCGICAEVCPVDALRMVPEGSPSEGEP
ncbi:MAG TPA: 4Fe-4S binding protein [Anaeromyxobacter sp.]|nr:4Fe-4S binding protein [Anaeromyxobacter sp.]